MAEAVTADLPAFGIKLADLVGGHVIRDTDIVMDDVSSTGEVIFLHDWECG